MAWYVVGKSVRGTSHIATKKPCQDAVVHRVFGDRAEWLAVVVCDGAGSAERSQEGAEFVCDHLSHLIVGGVLDQQFSLEDIHKQFQQTHLKLEEYAQAEKTDMKQFACTVLLAIVGPENSYFAQIGDGAIVVGNESDFQTIFWPNESEYANATDFFTSQNYTRSLQTKSLPKTVTELAVFTDGLQRLALQLDQKKAHNAFFIPMFQQLKQTQSPEVLEVSLAEFLNSERINQRTDDDKTLFLAVNR